MAKFDRYLVRQVLGSTVFAVVLLSLVLVLGNVFKEINELLVDQGAPIGMLGRFMLLVLPFSLVYTIPWGFLAGVLLVFGRLSADQELTAIRTAGWSLLRIAMPVLLLGTVLSIFCFILNGNLGPQAKQAQRDLLYEVLRDDPLSLLNPGSVQSQLKGQKIFIESKEGSELRGFHAYQLAGGERDAKPIGYVYAQEVDLIDNTQEQQLQLRLKGAYAEAFDGDEVRHIFTEEAEPWIADYSARRSRKRKANAMETQELVAALRSGSLEEKESRKYELEIAQRGSFSLAPLALAWVAVPLGIGSRRRETSAGMFWSVLVAFGYFLLIVLAEEVDFSEQWKAQILVWLPNLVCAVVGGLLLWRAGRRA